MNATITPPPMQTQLITGEEFFAKHEHDHVELVKGIVKELPMTTIRHGKICLRVGKILLNYVDEHDLGHVVSNDSKIRFFVGPDTVYGPDVCYFSYETMPRDAVPEQGLCKLIPELVCEVRSPSDTWSEAIGKMVDYLKSGVQIGLLFDYGTETVSIYYADSQQVILHSGDTLELPDLFPGFTVPVERFFE